MLKDPIGRALRKIEAAPRELLSWEHVSAEQLHKDMQLLYGEDYATGSLRSAHVICRRNEDGSLTIVRESDEVL